MASVFQSVAVDDVIQAPLGEGGGSLVCCGQEVSNRGSPADEVRPTVSDVESEVALNDPEDADVAVFIPSSFQFGPLTLKRIKTGGAGCWLARALGPDESSRASGRQTPPRCLAKRSAIPVNCTITDEIS
jgi:hypothetical protein